MAIVMGLGVLGAALFYGDGMLTPAISVVSAVSRKPSDICVWRT